MAFSHGKSAVLWLNGIKISQWLRSITFNPQSDLAETSVFETDDKSYIGGMKSSNLSADGLFDGAASRIDAILNDILGDQPGAIFTWLPQGNVIGGPMKGMLGSNTAQHVTAATSDVATVHLEATSNVGHESGIILEAHAARTATANGTSVDQAASSAEGAAAYLQVSAGSPDAGTLNVKVQHSVDNAVWVDLITFTQVAGTADPTAQRGSATGTVNRYIRATWTIAGVTPSFSFLVGFHRA